jgi:phage tail P2-like protein
MTAPAHLLPANASTLERALSESIGRFNPPQHVRALWNAATCPVAVLPYLAWALSVDEWDPTWPDEMKRAAIAEARTIHKRKGTPSAIRRALTVVGQGDADIVERADYIRRDGTSIRNGLRRRMGPDAWATYRIVLKRPITLDQAEQIRQMLAKSKRNCVHLVALDYSRAALRHNGVAHRDGSYVRGIIT